MTELRTFCIFPYNGFMQQGKGKGNNNTAITNLAPESLSERLTVKREFKAHKMAQLQVVCN